MQKFMENLLKLVNRIKSNKDINEYPTRCNLHTHMVGFCRSSNNTMVEMLSDTTIAEPEIAVGHWPFSDQFQDLANQK